MNKHPSRRRLQFSLKSLFFVAIVVSLGSCIFVLINELNRQKDMLQMERARAMQLRDVAEQIKLEATVQREAAESNAKLAQEEQQRALANLARAEQQAMELARRALSEAGVPDEQAEEILRRLAGRDESR